MDLDKLGKKWPQIFLIAVCMCVCYLTLQLTAHRELEPICLPSEFEFGHMTYFGQQNISTGDVSIGLKKCLLLIGACYLLLLGMLQPPYKEAQVNLLDDERPMGRDSAIPAVLAEAPDM